jgi:hypothetical protein
MFNREVLIRPPEPFAIPMYSGRDNQYPSQGILDRFLINLEEIMIGRGIEFPTELPIAAAITAPIDDMTDIYATLTFLPHTYPAEKYRQSDIFVGSRVIPEINSINLSLQGSPWANGDYKGKDDEYETRYWATDAYIIYLHTVFNQLDEIGLFVPGPPAFRYLFVEAS